MPIRLKKLIGMLLLVLLVVVYAIVSTAFAVAQLADKSALVHLAFYLVTGLLWVLPAMALVKWMEGKPRRRGN
ncbi:MULTISPECIES: DUF2842 domain-containing protein [Chelativorans]|jgi:hypothetical protein|uniref:DUF2842 domain-containing protein n=1 Tax=Chelativorans sp. (strain BNC1) TaxID=266779 RepID=Q11J70_CHESB|nr:MULTISPECIES: DUF2842 domain-containing protein [Chelativorans]